MNYPAFRRARLLDEVQRLGLSGLVVTNTTNVTYLTGFTGDSSYLFLGRDKTLLLSDGRYQQQIKEQCDADLDVFIRTPAQRIVDAAAQELAKLGWGDVGFESNHLTVAGFEVFKQATPAVNWKPCSETVEMLRMIKDAGELATIRRAIELSQSSFREHLVPLLRARPEIQEGQAADHLEWVIRSAGGRVAFPIILAAGDRSSLPHYHPNTVRADAGELVLIDWGAEVDRYKSDLTRVLPTRKISPKFAQVFAAVQQAQSRAIAIMRPGVLAKEVDAEARAALDAAGFGPFFCHGLGHGFGLDIHEIPFLRGGNEMALQPGMVITVEPGVYLEGWGGIRLEDDVLITDEGCEVLTNLPKDWDPLW